MLGVASQCKNLATLMEMKPESSLKNGVVGVTRQGDRIILVKLVVGDMVLNVISAYAP